MDEVNVNPGELLEILKKNRQRHVENYAIAMEERTIEVGNKLAKYHEKLSDPEFQMPELVKFPAPQNNVEDYDRAIMMAEMTKDETINLDRNQFDSLVMDNWHWQKEFMRTSSLYAAGKLK